MPKQKELNIKQQRFLEHYLKSGNGAESVRVAGYKSKNPDSYASQLLKNKVIRSKTQDLSQNIDSSIENVMKEIDSLAFGIPKDNLTYNVKVKCLELLAKIKKIIGTDNPIVDNRQVTIFFNNDYDNFIKNKNGKS